MLKPALISLLLLVSPAVYAQDASTTATATALADVLNPPELAKAGLERQIASIREGQMIRAMLGNQPAFNAEAAKNKPAFNAALQRMGAMQAQAMGPIFTEMQAASRKAAVDAYAKQFTTAEMTQIMAFYKTPAGAKLLRTQPQISNEISRSVQQTYGPRMEAAQKAVAPKIQAELQKLFPQAAAPKG